MASHTKRDYYEILGVTRTAAQEEIKSAYRKAALKWHPDRNPDKKEIAEGKFREATEAYSVLFDAQKRAAYDRFGHAGVSGADSAFNGTIFEEFRDIFGDFFGFEDVFGRSGGARSRSRVQRGNDLRYDMRLSFEEAAAGVTTKIRIPRQEFCETCNGTGAKAGTGVSACETCKGHGQLHYQQGFFAINRTCPACQGAGQVIREKCPGCRGKGRLERTRVIDVRIPPGVDSQTRIRLQGEGEPGANGGPPGDLYIVLEVNEHPFFERRGADLYCTIPINILAGGAGRRDFRARAARRGTGLHTGGHANRRHPSPQGERPARPARRGKGRPVRQRARHDAGQAHARPAASAAAIGRNARSRKSPRGAQLFVLRKDERHLRLAASGSGRIQTPSPVNPIALECA